jgi:hypothetical protein
MSEQTYTVAAVSERQKPEQWSFTKDGETINMLTYRIKVEGSDSVLRLFRSPKTDPPKKGDTLVGEIVDEERGPRLKVKSQPPGRGGQQRREDPREVRANMAVKTAWESAVFGRKVLSVADLDTIKNVATESAKFIYQLATELSQG